MVVWIYNFVFLLGILVVWPWLLFGAFVSKKFQGCLSAYLGFRLPKEKKETKGLSFLVYAVSVGEVKSAVILCKKIKQGYPDAFISFASRTKTGYLESQKSFPEADRHFLMPFDFFWVMKRLMSKLRVNVVILVEGDLWINFLRAAKKTGAAIFLVSAKISLRSFKRLQAYPFFCKEIIPCFDLICTQNSLFQKRFIQLGACKDAVVVTGNLKLDAEDVNLSNEEVLTFRKQMGIGELCRVVTVGSTHAEEEKEIIRVLSPLFSEFPALKLIIVPRHPERFSLVKKEIADSPFSFISFSQIAKNTGEENIILGDVMGKLSSFYQIADIAIVGGSFIQTLKGHNILEPVFVGTPVLFGPYMSDQTDLVSICLENQAGIQVPLNKLHETCKNIFNTKALSASLRSNGKCLNLEIKGASCKTLNLIKGVLVNFSDCN